MMAGDEALPPNVLNAMHQWEDSIKKVDEELKHKGNIAARTNKVPIRGSSQMNETASSSVTKTIRFNDSVSAATGKDAIQQANLWKEKGNAFFKENKYEEAVKAYSTCLSIDEKNPIFWTNRALAYLKLQKFSEAVQDCTSCLKFDEGNIKAYSRRASAYKSLGKYDLAIADLEKAKTIAPENKDIAKDLAEIRQLLASQKEKEQQELSKNPQTAPKPQTSEIDLVPVSTKHTSEKPLEPAKVISVVNAKRQKPTIIPMRKFNVQPRIPTTPPSTAYEFEATWRELKSNIENLQKYINIIDPDSYSTLFKDSMTASVFASFLSVAKFNQEKGEYSKAIGILRGLSTIMRFDMMVLLLSSEEKSDVLLILEHPATPDKELAQTLKQKYQL